MLLPKVLIINQPFNTNTGGGITLSNLFGNWNREKLAVACSGYLLTDDMDVRICNNYYQLGSKERKWMFPFHLFRRKYYSGTLKFTGRSKQNILEKKSNFRVKLLVKYLYPVLDFLGFSHFITRTYLSDAFCSWIDEFAPEVLYTQASSLEDILFCLEVKKYTGKPLIFHMMDDWPATLDRKGLFAKHWRDKTDKMLKVLLTNTDLAMCISDYMAEEYKRRYGKEFVTFHNPIDLEFWEKHQRQEYKLQASPTLLYAGRIGLGIDDSLKTIARTIEAVNEKFNFKLRFVIQSSEAPTWIDNFEVVKHQEFVVYQDLPKVFAETDFLILPYDFDEDSIKFIKYSMPTKASEYMASGSPIIIFSPEDTALVKYAKEYGWAVLVTKNKEANLAETISGLLCDENLRKNIAEKAKNIAGIRHDKSMVSENFKKCISGVVDKNKVKG